MFGERLKLARKKSGYSLRNLAIQIDEQVSAQALGKYERGEMMPSSNVLVTLSKALHEPVSYFMSPMDVRLEGVDFRKRAGTSAKDRARVEAAVLDHVERYLMIEEILNLDTASWDQPFAEKKISTLEDVDEVADRLRREWKLGKDPIPDMTELLEEHGIKVFALPLPDNVSGLTCLISRPDQGGTKVPVIVVNSSQRLERRRLTLAHELAHRLIDPKSQIDLEKAANRFAGAFLVSTEHLRHESGKHRHALGYRELIELKHLYRISAAALLVRLEQLGIIENATMVYAFKTFARGWRREEPEPIENSGAETTRRFERLCYWALSEKLISLAKATELLRKPTAVIREDVRGPVADSGHRE